MATNALHFLASNKHITVGSGRGCIPPPIIDSLSNSQCSTAHTDVASHQQCVYSLPLFINRVSRCHSPRRNNNSHATIWYPSAYVDVECLLQVMSNARQQTYHFCPMQLGLIDNVKCIQVNVEMWLERPHRYRTLCSGRKHAASYLEWLTKSNRL